MNFEELVKFLNSTFFNTIAVGIVGAFAYWIGKTQAKIQDSVELYASLGIMKDIATQNESKIIYIQNVGTRVLYFDSYEFNGKPYELNGQVQAPTCSGAINSFYRISLPINGECHVSLFVYFHDAENRKWKSKIICDFQNQWWDIKTYPREFLK